MKKSLFNAIATNSSKLLEELLQSIAVTEDVNVMHEALQLAMQNNRLEIVERLLEFPVIQKRLEEDANLDNNYILIWAAKNGHLTLVKKLLQIVVVEQNAHAQNNFALRFALENGDLTVVKTLLEISVVAEYAHLDNNWVLQWAIKNNHVFIAKQLLQLSGVKNNLDVDNNWILKLAKNKCPDLVQTLEELIGVENNTHASNGSDGCAPVVFMHYRDQQELNKSNLDKFKLELGACALNRDASEPNLLFNQFNQRLLKSLESMSYVREEPNASNHNDNDDNAPAVGMRQKEKKLNESTLDADALNGTTLLEAAFRCEKDALEQISALVANGVNINFASPDSGITALHCAVIKGGLKIMELLIQQKADFRARDKSGETPLEMAARLDNKEAVMMLLEAEGLASPDIEKVVFKVVFIAASYRNIPLLCALLKRFSFNVNTVFPNGETLLGIFIKQRNALAISDLKEVSDSLAVRLDLDQKVPTQDNQRPIVLAIKNGDIEVISALADAGANLSIDDNFPAHLAVFHGMLEIVKLLHARGVVMDKDSDCETPIHTAVESNQREILAFFRTQNLNFDVYCDEIGNSVGTPLCRAIFKKNHDLVRWFFEERGVSLNGPGYKNGENEHSPVIAAIMDDNLQDLKYLASLGADLAVTNGAGDRNSLQEAMASCAYRCIEFLASQIPIDMQQFYEEIPGIDQTMISYMEDAVSTNALKTLKMLHNLGFDIRRIDPETDLTMTHQLLHILAENRFSAALNNVDLNIKNSKGETPLHLAVLGKNNTVVAGLLAIACTQKDLNIDAMDNKGDTPLHKACEQKDNRIINALLNAGASTTVLNNKKQTPLDIYPEVKAQLEAKKKAIDTANVASTLIQFRNSTQANSTTESASSENNASNKRAKIE